MSETLVVDASAIVDLLIPTELGRAVGDRLRGHDLHAPAHVDAEVLSALGRLHRDARVSDSEVTVRLEALAAASLERHLLVPLIDGAWRRRHSLRLVDALYVELAEQLSLPLVTTDRRLGNASHRAVVVTSD